MWKPGCSYWARMGWVHALFLTAPVQVILVTGNYSMLCSALKIEIKVPLLSLRSTSGDRACALSACYYTSHLLLVSEEGCWWRRWTSGSQNPFTFTILSNLLNASQKCTPNSHIYACGPYMQCYLLANQGRLFWCSSTQLLLGWRKNCAV